MAPMRSGLAMSHMDVSPGDDDSLTSSMQTRHLRRPGGAFGDALLSNFIEIIYVMQRLVAYLIF